MSGVRVLVGTRKGAFVLTSDGKRQKWDVADAISASHAPRIAADSFGSLATAFALDAVKVRNAR